MIIAIEGNIGAGKSTFCDRLSKATGWHLMEEPVDTNPYLELYYENPRRWGTEMQQFLLSSRFNHYLEAMELSKTKPVIMDRSLFGDRVFCDTNHQAGNICDRGLESINLYWKAINKVISQPEMFVLLNTSADVCLKRIQSRGRECEQGIPLGYLGLLDKNYNKLLKDFEDTDAITMDVDWNTFHTDALIDRIVTVVQHKT